MFKVIKRFVDLKDGNLVYEVGDTYPHAGHKASDERIAELASAKNKQGQPLIEKIEEPKAEKPEKKSKKKGK